MKPDRAPLHIRALAWGSVIVVVATVVASAVIVGSPATVRARKADDERVYDLDSLKSGIQRYYENKDQLPKNIEGVEFRDYHYTDLRDPVTGLAYEYEATGAKTYRLGATFQLDSIRPEWEDDEYFLWPFSDHKAGHQWFDLEVTGP